MPSRRPSGLTFDGPPDPQRGSRVLPNGAFVRGQSDKVCVGCHQGSNRTVLQFWGIRLDQNQDLNNNFQYPANPVTFVNGANDTRLFDPAVNNNTFNGRNADQLIVYEDYDGDLRDDTPPDVHYEAGMGCIDCHGSQDVHSGTEGGPINGQIFSHQNQRNGHAVRKLPRWPRDATRRPFRAPPTPVPRPSAPRTASATRCGTSPSISRATTG